MIHEYLNEHRMRMYIPQKYTFPKDHPEEIARRLKRKNEKRKRNNDSCWICIVRTHLVGLSELVAISTMRSTNDNWIHLTQCRMSIHHFGGMHLFNDFLV